MMESDFDPPFTAESDNKSKTQIKKEMQALQVLGTDLVNLTQRQLEHFPLDDELRDAISIAQRINRKKEGFRRQLQYIGKLMRSRDTDSIQIALEKMKQAHHQSNQAFHALEKLRDNILAANDQQLEHILAENSTLDRQKLRQLKRQASKEQQLNKPPKSARELFQYLKQRQ
jgi:ribosome-associated protein